MEINLADLHARINTNRLYAEHFQCPVTRKSDVSEPCRHVNKKSEPSHRGPSLQHRNKAGRFRMLRRSPQVQLMRFQQKSFFRYFDEMSGIFFLHIQFMVIINHKVIRQCQVITVGIQLLLVKRSNHNFFSHMTFYFSTG